MRKLNYPLIISDFDGTLFRSDHTIAPETIEKINEYVNAGGIFVVSTGRGIRAILPQVQELGLKGLVSSYQGSTIANIETGELLVDGGMSKEDALRVCLAFEEDEGIHTQVYTLNDFYVNKDNEARRVYEEITKTKGIYFEGKASDFIKTLDETIKKVNVLVAPQDKMRVYNRMRERLGSEFYVAYSAATLVEVSAKDYSKGTALRFIANHFGVPIEKTIAIGDNLNDLPMLEVAGLGIPVANADEKLKAIMPAYKYSNNENAVGRIIEEYGFIGEKV